MQSWSLRKFVDEYGCIKASTIWGVSHQAVLSAMNSKREIKVILVDGLYEVHESKRLDKGTHRSRLRSV